MTARWYIIHVYSGFERKVMTSIREQAQQQGLQDLFEEIIVPMEEVVEVKRGKKVNAERKFFPRSRAFSARAASRRRSRTPRPSACCIRCRRGSSIRGRW
jgi:hypothetical protein